MKKYSVTCIFLAALSAFQTQIAYPASLILKESIASIKVGEQLGGGTIIYMDNRQRKGLIAAPADAKCGTNTKGPQCIVVGQLFFQWWDETIPQPTGTAMQGTALFSGENNTFALIASENTPAALAARNYYTADDYICSTAAITCTDWYLPAVYELNLMYVFGAPGSPIGSNPDHNIPASEFNIALKNFTTDSYWSSSEAVKNLGDAWVVNFRDGQLGTKHASMTTSRVRPVRAFNY